VISDGTAEMIVRSEMNQRSSMTDVIPIVTVIAWRSRRCVTLFDATLLRQPQFVYGAWHLLTICGRIPPLGREQIMPRRMWSCAPLVDRLQVLAGTAPQTSRDEVAYALRNIAANIPHDLPRVSAVVLRSVCTAFILRLGRQWGTSAETLAQAIQTLVESSLPAGEALASAIATLAAEDATAIAPDSRVRLALGAIEQLVPAGPLSVRDVAPRVNLSTWHLQRLLRRHTGRSFAECVRHARLMYAMRYLRGSMLSVKEVSARVGYTHCSSFCRDFRRAYGCAPTAWRARRVASAGR
jgi:AraC-like DNA-binding protein